jgi:hypothetical protein
LQFDPPPADIVTLTLLILVDDPLLIVTAMVPPVPQFDTVTFHPVIVEGNG